MDNKPNISYLPQDKFMQSITLRLSIALASLLSTAGHADSKKLFSETTEHYYQRFDTGGITWKEAKLKCEAIDAHLATITTQEEENFIDQILLVQTTNYYFIGGTDAAKEGIWKWITGEKWSYKIWSKGGDNGPQPSHRPDENYLLIGPNSPASDIAWFDINSTTPETGYICEWSVNKNIATTIVPDLNKNDADEIAVLSVDYKTGKQIVKIKDSETQKLLNTLIFSTDSAYLPQGLVALKDINNNGKPEIGVLYKQNEQPAVFIKDAQAVPGSPLLKTLLFLNTAYKGSAVTIMRDSNGNGADEIAVLSENKTTLATLTEIRDSKTGSVLKKVGF